MPVRSPLWRSASAIRYCTSSRCSGARPVSYTHLDVYKRQRQLLAIARAAGADPPVLILDEATSSIDTRPERIVQEGMDRLMAGRTVLDVYKRQVQAAYRTPVFFKKRRTPGESVRGRRPGRTSSPSRKNPVWRLSSLPVDKDSDYNSGRYKTFVAAKLSHDYISVRKKTSNHF